MRSNLAESTLCARCVAVTTLRARESPSLPEIGLTHLPLRAQVADLKTASEPSADVLPGLRRLHGASFAPRGGCLSTVHVGPRGRKGARPPSPRIHPTTVGSPSRPPHIAVGSPRPTAGIEKGQRRPTSTARRGVPPTSSPPFRAPSSRGSSTTSMFRTCRGTPPPNPALP